MIFAIFCALAGIALGRRFKVLVLLPAVGVVLALTIAKAVAHFDGFWPMCLVAAGDIVSLQIGYLFGLGILYLRIGVRDTPLDAESMADSTPTRRSAHLWRVGG
jgi:hypothetical protein